MNRRRFPVALGLGVVIAFALSLADSAVAQNAAWTVRRDIRYQADTSPAGTDKLISTHAHGGATTFRLPTTRLLIAGVFPDETVEFSFATLPPTARAACGESTPATTVPRLLREVKPRYTAAAMKQKIEGSVLVQCVVQPDGSVGDVRVLRSLDARFGLDDEAMKAARQWRFAPGTRDGVPVAVLVTIELHFSLRR